MDPLWATIAEFWWIGPATIGTGTLGWLGLRRERRERRRRIELDAARLEMHTARREAAAARARVRVARTELARVQTEQTTGRAGATDVSAARHALDHATDELRVATATVRVRRAHVAAARAALPSSTDVTGSPTARLLAAHDAVTARWMTYETDPARLIAFPAMTDARRPLTAAFLAAEHRARELRPVSPQARITPPQFTAYRDAVAAAARAFDAAEADAWRQARAAGDAPARPAPGDPDAPHPGTPPFAQWTVIAQSFTEMVVSKGAEAFTRAMSTPPRGSSRSRTARDRFDTAPRGESRSEGEGPADPTTGPVWPVPRRPRA